MALCSSLCYKKRPTHLFVSEVIRNVFVEAYYTRPFVLVSQIRPFMPTLKTVAIYLKLVKKTKVSRATEENDM